MWIVRLLEPIPGIRSEIFGPFSQLEAEKFAQYLHERWPDAKIQEEKLGQPGEVLY